MKTFLFDCDGVVLDSNRIKSEAFAHAAAPYGADLAEKLVAHHKEHGGVSRYLKFRFFLENIAQVEFTEDALQTLLDSYAEAVRNGLLSCDITDGLEELRATFPDSTWLIVSGGDQTELREIFHQRGLDRLFDGGIFGSPDTKEHILERQIAAGMNPQEAIFIGDSRYDHLAAQAFGIDFVFAHGWTEFSGWSDYVRQHEIPAIERASDLRELLQKAQREMNA